MARELYFYPDAGCYVVRWIDDLRVEDLIAHWKDLLERPEYDASFAALHDARERSILAGYAETVEGRDVYVRDVAPKIGSGRVAVLVDNPSAFGSGRQLTVMTGLEEDSLVTYSEEAAKQWVGLSGDFELPYVLRR
jgi:hypothetical protein